MTLPAEPGPQPAHDPAVPAQPYPPYQPQHHLPMPPDKNLGWVIAGVLVFWPVAIPALLAVSKVSDLWFTGRHQEAFQAAADAKRWGRIAVIVGACYFGLMTLGYVAFILFAVVLASQAATV